ncbi:TetR/AcrR family transcriptional regulator [Pseudonocardia halophobica]|uniref:TetR family transcriptional regulator n=1 Tax=Pseudonocardia halophobica TaxID=29401 RepID=A0A9W6NXK9_9PSEU|nr:TetR/AcrR family transcriptional regulator [Pseudonocardia halophobica]GLL12761.1 TetR family transcriptional regulator [Pseudonocardia halophobica]
MSTAGPGRRERKKQQTRAALSAAALRLAAERGVDHVSVEDIAEAADVSVRTFFNYFSRKEEAVLGRDPEHAERVRERLRTAPPDLPPLATVRYAFAGLVEQLESERESFGRLATVLAGSPRLLGELVAIGAEDERRLADLLAELRGISYPHALLVVSATGIALRIAVEEWGLLPPDSPHPPLRELADRALDRLAAGLDSVDRPGAAPSDTDPTPKAAE